MCAWYESFSEMKWISIPTAWGLLPIQIYNFSFFKWNWIDSRWLSCQDNSRFVFWLLKSKSPLAVARSILRGKITKWNPPKISMRFCWTNKIFLGSFSVRRNSKIGRHDRRYNCTPPPYMHHIILYGSYSMFNVVIVHIIYRL